MNKLYILTKVGEDIKMVQHQPETTFDDIQIKTLQKEALQQSLLAWVVYIN